MSLSENFNAEIHSIENRFNGGLSNTSTRKFDELVKIVSEISGVDEDKIYITAATSRASNLWNRLAQGKPLTQHFSLALGIIDASDLQGGILPATKFIGAGVGHYDAIALTVRRDGKWVVGAVLDTDVLPIYDKFSAVFSDTEITHEQLSSDAYATDADVEFAWYVGTTGSNANGEWRDNSDEYIDQGIWVNGWEDKFVDDVESINPGDRIAIKSAFTQKNNLPFENHGKTVAAMRIKAIGVVTENPKDGKSIKVNWERLEPAKTWYGPGTLRQTIHRVSAEDGTIKKQLLDFTFSDDEQDYSFCEEHYADEEISDLQPDESACKESADETVIECDVLPSEAFSVEMLGEILRKMYEAADSKTSAIHMFGLKYGEIIKENNFSATAIVEASSLNGSYGAEVGKGIRLYESIKKNEFGVRFFSQDEAHDTHRVEMSAINMLPALAPRARKRFSLNNILYGAPGTGKTFATAQYALAIAENKPFEEIAAEDRSEVMSRYNALVSSGQIVFTTFHQNYGYEDFIQGIRPDTSAGTMKFKTEDGVFKVVADDAMHNPDLDFVIIIDEINRANISKVFGELITLLEDDKRWGEINAVNVTLPSGDIFAVPNNLYILGTMNSADKSISLIDTALRRRFDFIEFAPRAELIADADLRVILTKLNAGISGELGSTDLLIGHSYFMHKSVDDLCSIMNRNIIPLLYEYFFDNQKKVEAQIKAATEGYPVEVLAGNVGRIRLAKKD